MKTTKSRVIELAKMPIDDPLYGDLKLNIFPFCHPCRRLVLPNEFKLWEPLANRMLDFIPVQEHANRHFLTIDSKFFTVDETLRREGIHMDGNFCVDTNFGAACWGGATPTWGGATPRECPPERPEKPDEPTPDDESRVADTPWISPYDAYPPYGDYVSGEKGGILCVSSHVGCRAWEGQYPDPMAEGSYSHLSFGDDAIEMKPHTLYFMSSNTPHESTVIDAGSRRTFMRITLDHRYDNSHIASDLERVK